MKMTRKKTEASLDNRFEDLELRFLCITRKNQPVVDDNLEKEDMQAMNAFIAKAGIVSDDGFFGSL